MLLNYQTMVSDLTGMPMANAVSQSEQHPKLDVNLDLNRT